MMQQTQAEKRPASSPSADGLIAGQGKGLERRLVPGDLQKVPLELAAARRAIALSPDLPDDVYLSINASPATTCHPVFAELIATTPGTRIVVELTEHIGIDDYDAVVAANRVLRWLGQSSATSAICFPPSLPLTSAMQQSPINIRVRK